MYDSLVELAGTDGPFGTIYLDPPWPTGKASNGWMGLMNNRPYSTMTESEVLSIPLNDIASANAMVVIWSTWGRLGTSIKLMESNGFHYGTGMPWIKVVKGSGPDAIKPIFGPGTWFQHCTELLLLGRRGRPFGKLGNPRPARKGLIVAQRQEHSRKPEEVAQWIEDAQFPCPRIELFARRPRKGWTVWGNEV